MHNVKMNHNLIIGFILHALWVKNDEKYQNGKKAL